MTQSVQSGGRGEAILKTCASKSSSSHTAHTVYQALCVCESLKQPQEGDGIIVLFFVYKETGAQAG